MTKNVQQLPSGSEFRGEHASPSWQLAAFRWLVVVSQAATLLITWPLWKVRDWPPNLSLIELPQIDFGWLLLASLALVLIRPVAGVVLHTGLLAVAVSMDQMRIQPECISLTFLLWGTLPWAAGQLLCRAHLLAMWFFAGFHKLNSETYLTTSGRQMWQSLQPALADAPATALAVAAACGEILLALLIISPRTRKAAAWLACVLHAGVLIYLVQRDWNHAVWPWNVALAMSGFALIGPWRSSLRETFEQSSWPLVAAVLLIVISPAGYYLGLVDAYLAHCLYSSNTPTAWFESDVAGDAEQRLGDEHLVQSDGDRTRLSYAMLAELNVPFPPAHRLFEAYFQRVSRPGDRLEIHDPRAWARRRGIAVRTLTVDGEYRNGKKHGWWTLRYDNGAKAGEGLYSDGQQQGAWTYWFEDGRPEALGIYHNGQMHGKWIFHYEDGRTLEAEYRDGEVVNKKAGTSK